MKIAVIKQLVNALRDFIRKQITPHPEAVFKGKPWGKLHLEFDSEAIIDFTGKNKIIRSGGGVTGFVYAIEAKGTDR